MKTLLLATVMSISITSGFASERPNVFPEMSSLLPSRLESGICKSAYLINYPASTIDDKLYVCNELLTPEKEACEDKIYKNLGKLDTTTTLEISANPTNEAAEDDFLKETLKIEIKTKGKVILERTAIGLFYSSGSQFEEGNMIRFEDIVNKSTPIDTFLMNLDYNQTKLTTKLEGKGTYYFSDCKLQWEATPKEEFEE